MNFSQVEKNLYQNPKQANLKDLNLLIDHYHQLGLAEKDIRKRSKIFRKVIYLIGWAVDLGVEDKDRLKHLLFLLEIVAKNHGWIWDGNKIRSKVVLALLKASGIEKIDYLKEIKGNVAVESGTLAVADPELLPELSDIPYDQLEREMSKQVELNHVCYFDTEGDGSFGVELRLVNAPEPVLKKNEYRYVIQGGQEGVIKVSSGQVAVSDISYQSGDDQLVLEVEPGEYRLAGFMVEKKSFFGFVFVLASVDQKI